MIINALLKVALESVAEEAPVIEPVSEAELQAAHIDVTEAHQEVQSVIEAEGRLSTAADALQALTAVPVSGDGSIAAIANESILLTIGVEGLGLEEAESTLAKIWAAIKNFVLKIIESIKNFFGKLTSGLNRLQSKFVKLHSDVRDIGAKIHSNHVVFTCSRAIDLQFGSYEANIGRTITGMGTMNTQLVRLFKAHSLLSSNLSDSGNIDNDTIDHYLEMFSKAVSEDNSLILIGGWKIDLTTGNFEDTKAREHFETKGSKEFNSNYQGILDLIQQCFAVIQTIESKYSLTTAGFNKVSKHIEELEKHARGGDEDAKSTHSLATAYRKLITTDAKLINKVTNVTNTSLHACINLVEAFIKAAEPQVAKKF